MTKSEAVKVITQSTEDRKEQVEAQEAEEQKRQAIENVPSTPKAGEGKPESEQDKEVEKVKRLSKAQRLESLLREQLTAAKGAYDALIAAGMADLAKAFGEQVDTLSDQLFSLSTHTRTTRASDEHVEKIISAMNACVTSLRLGDNQAYRYEVTVTSDQDGKVTTRFSSASNLTSPAPAGQAWLYKGKHYASRLDVVLATPTVKALWSPRKFGPKCELVDLPKNEVKDEVQDEVQDEVRNEK